MYRIGILTASDKGSWGERADASGQILHELVKEIDGEVAAYLILPDDRDKLAACLRHWSDDLHMDLILTTGGTGFSRRDVTPEATMDVAERLAPGIAEAMRLESLKLTPKAMLSRATSVIRGSTLIINLPGSTKAVRECWAAIMPALKHGLQILSGDATECGSSS